MNIEELLLKQHEDGSFGRFHSMSRENSLTTEKVLRRCFFLNLDKDHSLLSKCLEYLKKCLNHEIMIPDRREKVINWDVFEELMFSAWLHNFRVTDEKVIAIQQLWAQVIENSVIDGKFDMNEYKKQYRLVFGKKGLREIDPASFYMVSLLRDGLNVNAKQAYFQFILKQGIYYIYHHTLSEVPRIFDSQYTINYLIAIKLVAPYASSKDDLRFVRAWLDENRSVNGHWEMPDLKPDGFVFPRSDNWRKYEHKLADINSFIHEILFEIEFNSRRGMDNAQ
jgi:hypothetical protein